MVFRRNKNHEVFRLFPRLLELRICGVLPSVPLDLMYVFIASAYVHRYIYLDLCM
jgi:hypothetical protein